jgi:hypothetical protein
VDIGGIGIGIESIGKYRKVGKILEPLSQRPLICLVSMLYVGSSFKKREPKPKT